eukprot:7247826-Prymnesium_polylepis.1
MARDVERRRAFVHRLGDRGALIAQHRRHPRVALPARGVERRHGIVYCLVDRGALAAQHCRRWPSWHATCSGVTPSSIA